MPKVDLIERDADIIVRAELPGVGKDGLNVSMTDHSVSIKATRKKEEKKEEGECYIHKLSHGQYQRTLALPENVDGNKAKASFEDGLLELVIPKRGTSKRRTIKVS